MILGKLIPNLSSFRGSFWKEDKFLRMHIFSNFEHHHTEFDHFIREKESGKTLGRNCFRSISEKGKLLSILKLNVNFITEK